MSRPILPATETDQDGLLTESPTDGLSEEEGENTVAETDATNGSAAIPQEPDGSEEEDDADYSEGVATDTGGDDDEDEDEDEEPALKYERLEGAVPDLLRKDSASTLAIANKVIVGFISDFPALFILTKG